MALYFFHLAAPGIYSADEMGCELDSAEAAYLEGHQSALEIAFEMLRARIAPSEHRFEICSEGGVLVFELRFSEVMRPAERTRPPRDLHASLQRNQQRATRAALELSESFAQARALLDGTLELLAKS